MAQATFEFETPSPRTRPDDTGFELGWDHAHHAVVPPAEHLHPGNPVRQGWEAGKAVFGRRTLQATCAVRQWLQLRLEAWLRGRVFEATAVTPNHLVQIDAARCPITRRALSRASGGPDDALADRVLDTAGYAAGNLAVMSTAAHHAKGACGWQDAIERVLRIEADPAHAPIAGLGAAEWLRLAVLMSFVTPLPHEQAARLPLRLLPPNRLRLLNPVQGLQALVTWLLADPGWSGRIRRLAERLPGDAPRHDFSRFVNAMVPRLIAARRSNAPLALRDALEDAWADELVNRRWQRFALALGEARIEALLPHAAALLPAGRCAQAMSRQQATEGWALATRGRVEAVAEAADWPTEPMPTRALSRPGADPALAPTFAADRPPASDR